MVKVKACAAIAVLLSIAMTAPAAAFALPDLLRQTPPVNQSLRPQPIQGCCKTCRKGKACGDSCISRNDECHVGAGCACNG